jgi:hypothetical protein
MFEKWQEYVEVQKKVMPTATHLSKETKDSFSTPLNACICLTRGKPQFKNVFIAVPGEVRLLHPIDGPMIYKLRLQMDNRNNANYAVSSHVAFIEVHVSQWIF